MTLRYATLQDVPAIMDIARLLYTEGPYSSEPFDEVYIRQQVERFIIEKNDKLLLLVSVDDEKVVGALAAYAFSPLFSRRKLAVEPLMYLDPDYRTSKRGNELLDAYEFWAKRVGAKGAQTGRLVSTDPRLEVLYKRRGYKKTEEVFFKEL